LCETLNQQIQTNASSNLKGDEIRLMKPQQ
jgi:hypothetical protein